MNNAPTTASTGQELAYANLLANLPGMVYRCLNQKNFPMEFASEGCLELTGYASADLVGNGDNIAYGKLIHPDDQQMVWDTVQKAIQTNTAFVLEYRIFRKDGQMRWVWEKGCSATSQDHIGVIDGVILDITSRKESEEAAFKANEKLQDSESRFKLLNELAPSGIIISDQNQNILHINQRFTDLFGYTTEDVPSVEKWWPLAYPDPVQRAKVREDWAALMAIAQSNHSEIVSYETQVTCKNGSTCQVDFRAASNGELIIVLFSDITKRWKLTEQLRMAHKMESVGRLAGGVAHDFNNIAGVIIGYAELALEKVKEDDLLREDLTEILEAGKRSREITRQLLAFARKQCIRPVKVDLNELIGGILSMLRRLIGENIDLAWLPETDLWPVNFDPAQLDQILASICINARDAISANGKIIIETGNVVLDSYYCNEHRGFVPGEYAMIAVSDNGCGIGKEALDHLYEPFFSTKEQHHNGGMGLSVVYGIVKQNNGFINAYSELNVGTTIKVYLPRLIVSEAPPKAMKQPSIPTGDNEMLLLVEDDPGVMKMTKMLLERLGYRVIAAGAPRAAISLAKAHQDKIKLLITDVIMPEMDGRMLATQLQLISPELKILFMSGYTANVVAQQNILDADTNFIQKPFSMRDIANKVHKVLNQ
ncbi:MAG: PAS domain-containing protein [Candidatus Riflebacteria bacterium]|nr:PAS domain-containing protein [Candidatus Riflebacteria bacterium]